MKTKALYSLSESTEPLFCLQHTRNPLPQSCRYAPYQSMVFSACIHTDYHQVLLHNGRELEIALGLISCMVDRNVAFMTELYNVVVYRRIIGGCNDEEELVQFLQILLAKRVTLPN